MGSICTTTVSSSSSMYCSILLHAAQSFTCSNARQRPTAIALAVQPQARLSCRHVDIRMYEGLAKSRNRLSKRVVALQRKAEALQEQVWLDHRLS
jgi:hypothetical protein